MKKQHLALFDFDGTITSSDTLFKFIFYSRGWFRSFFGITFLLPILVSTKLGLIPNWRAKEIVLSTFFGGISSTEFQSLCDRFSDTQLPLLIRQKAHEEIKRHIQNGDRVVVVSASAENWVRKWAAANQIEVVATQLEVIDNKVTGRISGKNCQGSEKVDRIRKYLELDHYESIYTYGDTPGDQPMLNLGTHRFYKPFRN